MQKIEISWTESLITFIQRRKKMKHLINFFKDEEGATAVEYGIMVAAIAAVIITVVFAIGIKVDSAFDKVDAKLPA